MALDTYANLKTAIDAWLDRDDLSANVDDFIDLAEARHKSEVRIREMITRFAITVDARFETVPSDWAGIVSGGFRLLTNPVSIVQFVPLQEMNRQRDEGTGKPRFFTIHAEIEVNVTPDDSYSGELIYYASVDALSDSNTSNTILARAPDLYLYGALSASAPFLQNDERVPLWESLYKDALARHNGSARNERAGGPMVSRLSSATP